MAYTAGFPQASAIMAVSDRRQQCSLIHQKYTYVWQYLLSGTMHDIGLLNSSMLVILNSQKCLVCNSLEAC